MGDASPPPDRGGGPRWLSADVFVVHVAKDLGKEDGILEHVLLWDPKNLFGYAGAQSLEHALHGDI